jgi:hypothetical protein
MNDATNPPRVEPNIEISGASQAPKPSPQTRLAIEPDRDNLAAPESLSDCSASVPDASGQNAGGTPALQPGKPGFQPTLKSGMGNTQPCDALEGDSPSNPLPLYICGEQEGSLFTVHGSEVTDKRRAGGTPALQPGAVTVGNLALESALATGDMEVAVRLADAARFMSMTDRHVRRLLEMGKLVEGPEAPAVIGGGKASRTVMLASMPVDAQGRYWVAVGKAEAKEKQRQAGRASTLSLSTSALSTSALHAPAPLANGPAVYLPDAARTVTDEIPTEWQTQQLAIRKDALYIYNERLKGLPRGERSAALPHIAADISTTLTARFGYPISVSGGTLYRWKKLAAQTKTPGALVPKRHRHGSTKVTGEIATFIEAHYQTSDRLTARQVYERLVDFCANERLPIPHERSVSRYIAQHITPSEAALSREGAKSWRAHFAPRVHRTVEDVAVNEIWVTDTRDLDEFCWHPTAPRPVRLKMVCIADIRSGCMLAWQVIPRAARARDVAICIRRAAMRWGGLPGKILTDNGKDYQASWLWEKREFGMPCLAEAGVENITAIPFSPQSKAIESWFHWFSNQENQIHGYCGRNNKERPEALARILERGELLTFAQMCAVIGGLWEKRNQTMPVGERECPPAWYYGEGLPPSEWAPWANRPAMLPERPARYPSPALPEGWYDFFLERDRFASVRQDGILISKRRYYSDELLYHVGRLVTVMFDPEDMSEVRAIVPQFDDDGTRRQTVIRVPMAPTCDYDTQNEATQAILRERFRSEFRMKRAHESKIEKFMTVYSPESLDPMGTHRMALANAADGRTNDPESLVAALSATEQDELLRRLASARGLALPEPDCGAGGSPAPEDARGPRAPQLPTTGAPTTTDPDPRPAPQSTPLARSDSTQPGSVASELARDETNGAGQPPTAPAGAPILPNYQMAAGTAALQPGARGPRAASRNDVTDADRAAAVAAEELIRMLDEAE